MMRVDLPSTLKPQSRYSFKVKWWFNINDSSKLGGRSGFDYYEKDGNHVFTIAQFFPRMAVYNETEGWQHKQFLGSGEFALPFGNYKVRITVPSDHIVGATGVLQNSAEVLTAHQQTRLKDAFKATDKTVLIVSEDEAVENEKEGADTKKTWFFKAEKVRDFAFASSRKFIWDAMAVKFGERTAKRVILSGGNIQPRRLRMRLKSTRNLHLTIPILKPYPYYQEEEEAWNTPWFLLTAENPKRTGLILNV